MKLNLPVSGRTSAAAAHAFMGAAFADRWRTLKAGRSWMGLVKNRCNNGDYFWGQKRHH